MHHLCRQASRDVPACRGDMGLGGHAPVSGSPSAVAAPALEAAAAAAATAAADFDVLPSPAASCNDSLDTPSIFSQLSSKHSPGLLKRSSALDCSPSVLALPTEPDGHVDHALSTAVTTPLPDDCAPANAMNLIVGGALAPLSSPPLPPRHYLQRTDAGLRLPSFDALGIAAPHPDRFANLVTYCDSMDATRDVAISRRQSPTPVDADLLANFNATCLSASNQQTVDPKVIPNGGRTVTSPIPHDIAALTPPAETGDVRFIPVAPLTTIGVDSPSTELGFGSPTPVEETTIAAEQTSSPIPHFPATRPEAGVWIDGALTEILLALNSTAFTTNDIRVLSHALPSPSQSGHVFPSIIEAIHNSTNGKPTVWINVFHAIQGRFNLADLPTSPPNTPGPAIGGDDYFTQKVFDSAVCISDYQQDLSSLPRSPHPVVPPSSINVSIVERYIPPATSHEFVDMFSPSGPSILVDRLVELSPDRGTLVFVYPTKTGAQTFMDEFLSPVLDPLLRSIVVVNGLSSNLSTALGRMAAINQMIGYHQLQHSMAALCSKLTQRSSSMHRFHGTRAAFSLVHASRQEVTPPRDIWARDWWAKQEKQRIREAMTRYTQDAQKKSSNEHVDRAPTPTELIQQLLDGIERNPYPPQKQPRKGIEVGVFVIQRTG